MQRFFLSSRGFTIASAATARAAVLVDFALAEHQLQAPVSSSLFLADFGSNYQPRAAKVVHDSFEGVRLLTSVAGIVDRLHVRLRFDAEVVVQGKLVAIEHLRPGETVSQHSFFAASFNRRAYRSTRIYQSADGVKEIHEVRGNLWEQRILIIKSTFNKGERVCACMCVGQERGVCVCV